MPNVWGNSSEKLAYKGSDGVFKEIAREAYKNKDKKEGHYFIKRLDKIEFANKYDIDKAECFDFVSESEMDETETAFKEALENAFGK